jgi:hypothetical protein
MARANYDMRIRPGFWDGHEVDCEYPQNLTSLSQLATWYVVPEELRVDSVRIIPRELLLCYWYFRRTLGRACVVVVAY